jgi:hypothetical protein
MNPTEPKHRRWCWQIAAPVLLALAVSCGEEYPKAKITVRVVDEQGNPVKGAEAGITFTRFYHSGSKYITEEATTGPDGLFSASGRSGDKIFMGASKAGFYKTHGDYQYPPEMLGEERWEPWNPTVDLPLRRIGNPVPMYAKKFFVTILPEATLTEGGVGYDLLVGDWVEPHGKGTVKDMVFSLKRNYVESRDFEAELRITMPNPGDGFSPISPEEILEGSELPLPPTAHEEGYIPALVLVKAYHPYRQPKVDINTIEPNTDSFFLRVRTRLGPDGKVESAMYGKLVGPITWNVHGNTTADIDTTFYYVNPDGTRNVEFDPKRNLLQGLDSSESPRKP